MMFFVHSILTKTTFKLTEVVYCVVVVMDISNTNKLIFNKAIKLTINKRKHKFQVLFVRKKGHGCKK